MYKGCMLWKRPFERWKYISEKISACSSRNFCLQRDKQNLAIWTSSDVRKKFINYYKSHDHVYVPSSSVLPKRDEGSYFINAGMNQFKPVFLGTVDRKSDLAKYKRVVNSQKCIRVGGKHNDLADVGRDTYHHTFFEMLGNWSFGDYFKQRACTLAWNLLTEEYQLPKERLYVSYFGGDEHLQLQPDLECKEIWLGLGVPQERILPFGIRDNFWDMGDTGPCGPCTEIHYDHFGRSVQDAVHLVNSDCPSLVELWNLVFMQFERQPGGSLHPLPKNHVDTGMGLERLCAVMQGTISNYDTDLFTPIFECIQQKANITPYKGDVFDDSDVAYRIVADHARMFTVALADGLLPGNSQASAKLKHVMHRCIKYAKDVLKAPQGTVGSLVPVVAESLGDTYPSIRSNLAEIEEIVHYTEERYLHQVESCKKAFLKAVKEYGIEKTKSMTGEQIKEVLSGRFGHSVPPDILTDVAETYDFTLNMDAYYAMLNENKASTGVTYVCDNVHTVTAEDIAWLKSNNIPPTDDSPVYEYHDKQGEYTFSPLVAKVLALKSDNNFVMEVEKNEKEDIPCAVITDRTCLYAEKGGQVGDMGHITTPDGGVVKVEDTQVLNNYVIHYCVLQAGKITTNCDVAMHVDEAKRKACMVNHTATHILNYSLWKVLGKTRQQGSMVNENKLTFDFSLSSPMKQITSKDLSAVAELANKVVQKHLTVYKDNVEFNKICNIPGVRYLDDTVYPSTVRIISLGSSAADVLTGSDSENGLSQSVELCGGTHVNNTRDIGEFVIVGLESGTQGNKSLTAVTGQIASQAKINGENVRNMLKLLKEKLSRNEDRAVLNTDVQKIKKILGEQMLPKVDRDLVENEIAKMGRSLEKNINFKQQMKRTLEKELQQSHDGVLVKFIGNSNLREVATVLSDLALDIPVMILFTRGKKNTTQAFIYGVCHVPDKLKESNGLSVNEWIAHACFDGNTKPDTIYPQPKPKYTKGKDMRIIDTQKQFKAMTIDKTNNISFEDTLLIIVEKARDFVIRKL